jgi:arylsulfotransferase ASST
MSPAHRPILTLALCALLLALPAVSGAAPVAVTGPSCTPEALDASAQLDGAVTVSPMPGSVDASAQTQISFLGVPLGALSAVSVTGSQTGAHAGTLEAYSQGDGGSFVPRTPFRAGELVTVSAQLTLAGGAQPLGFHFRVADTDSLSSAPLTPHALAPSVNQQFLSRPDLKPPTVSVHTHSAGQAPGDEFLAPYGAAAQAGPMILDPAGRLVWFNPLRAPLVATNLRVQQLDGSPVLTWWQGTVTTHGFGRGVDVVVGEDYRTITEVKAGNGYTADLHEFQITPQGTALVSSYTAIYCDLTALGGGPDSAVTDSLMQEIDIKTGLVMFEWTSLDHVALSDSYSVPAASSPRWPFDFFHLNSINLDPDGTLLVSSRNTWAADDIDPRTGQVLWTLGGKHSSFVEGRGAATAFQHDARPIAANVFSMFDNGASPPAHAQSRGVVLDVDPLTHGVSVQTQYLHPGHPLLANSQGNMQALANGDWFVGWGQQPDLSEFSATGRLLFDASLPPGYESYRALRFRWSATPASAPALVVKAAAGGGAVAHISWNGATRVARWELLEGSTKSHLVRVDVVRRADFETAIRLLTRPSERFAKVRALDAAGAVLGSSAMVALPRNSHRGA